MSPKGSPIVLDRAGQRPVSEQARATNRVGRWLALLVSTLCFSTAQASWAEAIHLKTAPRQERVRLTWIPVLPQWETTWWVEVEAQGAGLCRLNYTARFTELDDVRPQVGSLEVGDATTKGLKGRVLVRCPRSVDYEKDLVVRLQVEACDGTTSAWSESIFSLVQLLEEKAPTPTPAEEPTEANVAIEMATVSVVVDPDTSMDEIKSELDQAARALGAPEATKIRLAGTTGKKVRFEAGAARPIRVDTPQPAPEPTPSDADPSKILGEIEMRPPRR